MNEIIEISKGAMVAIVVLQGLESVGISATLRYEAACGNERLFGQSRWFIFATLQKAYHFDASFTEADVHIAGDWIQFAARTCERIQGTLRRMAGGASVKITIDEPEPPRGTTFQRAAGAAAAAALERERLEKER